MCLEGEIYLSGEDVFDRILFEDTFCDDMPFGKALLLGSHLWRLCSVANCVMTHYPLTLCQVTP